MNNKSLSFNTSDIGTILLIFIIAFFSISFIGLTLSIVRGKDANLAKSCRSAAWMGFFVGLILLYLRFVLT